ncbi:MAG: hypothetical protein ABSB59_31295 [Streptosporangiaceae bacterium]|jgi:hypothetical protein
MTLWNVWASDGLWPEVPHAAVFAFGGAAAKEIFDLLRGPYP